MAIEKKLIHFSKLSDFETQLNAGNILDYSIVFIQDAKKIWTHGQYYDCNGGNGISDSPTFLRIGDADDEAKANFIAVANGEKSADYYICASNIEGTEVNGIISELSYDGILSSPSYISYTFYGTPIKGSRAGKILKIRTGLTPSTGIINTIYEAILDSKQNTITDLEDIRDGASKGATSVQPDDVATVATSGSYEDLTDKPVYITDFDILSLYNIAHNPYESLQADKQAIIDALSANKIVLVPYATDDDGVRGYATLVGYTEDYLYFKVITDIDEIIVETSLSDTDIYGQEVTLRQWSDKQDTLISGTNIKTINGQSIVGSGNLVIEDGTYIWDWDGSESGSITQDQWDALQRADSILVNIDEEKYIPQQINKTESEISVWLVNTLVESFNFGNICINSNLSYECFFHNATFIKSGGLKTINGQSLEGSGDIITPNIYVWEESLGENISTDITITSEKLQKILESDFVYFPQYNAIGKIEETDNDVSITGYSWHFEKSYTVTVSIFKGPLQGTSYVESILYATQNFVEEQAQGSFIEAESSILEIGSCGTTYYLPQGESVGVNTINGEPGQTITLLFNTIGILSTPPLILPENIIWANGSIPTLEIDTYYELSIRILVFQDSGVYHFAVLSPFKPV